MTSGDHEYSADERFERLLIDSAQGDELPSNVDAAWHELGTALKGMGLLAVGAGGALTARRAQRWLAAKWLVWGALTGSALTALSLRPSAERQSVPTALRSPASAVPAVQSSAPAARIEIDAPRRDATPTPTPRPTPHGTRSHVALSLSGAAPALGEAAPPLGDVAPSLSSTLRAQVELLDAARSAIATGAFADALRLAERYRGDFPNGELAPEAEVVAIEALVEQGRRQPAAERALRFLARYPGDPHTARVKWLVR